MKPIISASCFTEFENGYGYMITEYLADCGCNWKVDMWGNVRAAKVCALCMSVTPEQFSLLVEP